MLWGDAQDADLLAFYCGLGALRRAHPAIWEGPRATLLADDGNGLYAYRCGDALLVILNTGAQPQPLALDLAGWWVALSTGTAASFPAGLEPYEGLALTLVDRRVASVRSPG